MKKLAIIMCFLIAASLAFCNEKEVNDEKAFAAQINKIHAGGILLGTATTVFNICAVTNVALLVDLFSVSAIILSATITGVSAAAMLAALITGSVLLSSGIKMYRSSQVPLEKIQPFIAKKAVKLKRSAIISGVFCSCSGLMALTGIALICVPVINPICGILGNVFTFAGSCGVLSALPVMIVSLAMSSWLKRQTSRLSVDIGVTSGSTGELSCDRKRNTLEKPTGVTLALSVKF